MKNEKLSNLGCYYGIIIIGDKMNLMYNDRVVYEDEEISVIMRDEVHTSNGELLLTTKKHLDSLFDVDEVLLKRIHEVLKQMKNLIYDRLNPEGLRIISDYGKNNTDDSFCIKIIPYYEPQQPLVDIDIIYDKLK